MIDWQALLAGFAFYLIFEGLVPFFSPQRFKQTLVMVLQLEDSKIKIIGAIVIFCGIALLLLIKT